MKERIDWKAYKQELKDTINNERIWAMGASVDDVNMHIDIICALEEELEAIEQGDYDSVLCMHDEDYFQDFLLE